ncbi:MAG: PcfJ domain-containing protein [Bacilli bacterium]|nr:PcfJ domain-containing protein [Bacilli bacterium]
MKKNILKNIPFVEIKEEWKSILSRIVDTNIKYGIIANIETIEDETILVLSFLSTNALITNRVFLTKKDYITQDFCTSNMKWKVGSIETILGYYWDKNCLILDSASEMALSKFFNVSDLLLLRVEELQRKIKANRLKEKHEIEKKNIDKKMEIIPELPNNFKEWVDKKVLYDSRYIYYNYKTKEGYCTYCGTDVIVSDAKHNKDGVCPFCNANIKYKAIGKSRNIVDYGKATLLQVVNDELLVRNFDVIKLYGQEYRKPKLIITELQRFFVNKDKKIGAYEFNNFKQTGERRWCEGISSNNYYSMFYSKQYDFANTVLYTNNLEILNNTILKYSGLKEYALYKGENRFPVGYYIDKYLEFPGLEYLVKLGLYKLVDSMIGVYFSYAHSKEINIKGNNLLEVLGIDKVQLKTLQRINGGFNELHVIKEAKKANLKLSDEQILFISQKANIMSVVTVSKYTTVNKIIKYISSQSLQNINNKLLDWVDYINYCELLEYNLYNESILFPRDLTKSHDEVMDLFKDKKLEIYNDNIKKMHDFMLKTYSWGYGNFVVVVPKSYDDIVKEGDILGHCVWKSDYGKKIIEGKSVILFLRNKDNASEPYYTIEVDAKNHNVIQCRGKKNKDMDEKVEKIIEKYKAMKLQKLGMAA